MEEELWAKANAFASLHGRKIRKPLGSGIHGAVFALESQDLLYAGRTAVKVHESNDPYQRERDVYFRLRDAGVSEILGFHVPQILHHDDQLLAIEMTVVRPPFVLDFAGAYLDTAPEFPENVWEETIAQWKEKFGDRWPMVERILNELEEFGIHVLDVSPNNIRFD